MTALVLRVFLFLIAFTSLGYAFLLWRDPSWLHRYRFRRQTWGWIKGRKLERPIGLVTAGLAILGAAGAILLALTVPQ